MDAVGSGIHWLDPEDPKTDELLELERQLARAARDSDGEPGGSVPGSDDE